MFIVRPIQLPVPASVSRNEQLPTVIQLGLWTPRSAFPPSRPIDGRVFTCDNGLYLMSNPNRGDNDPIWGVGWAESDHWAIRAWGHPRYSGDLTAPPAQWRPPPSLTFLGRPSRVSFENVLAFERSRLTSPRVTIVNARYRMTDGAFVQYIIEGADKVKYMFGSVQPEPTDEPAAIEFRLHQQR